MGRRPGQAGRGVCRLLALALLTLALIVPQGSIAGGALVAATGGALSAWGYNVGGGLGDGTIINRDAPVRVTGTGTGGLVFVAIDAGGFHSLGLTANGTAYAWGYNEFGQLGNGTSGSGAISTTPVPVSGTGPGGIVLTAIAAGENHSLGLAANGTAYAWGDNTNGQLGNGVSGAGARSTTPVQVSGTGPGGIVLSAIDAGGFHSLGLTASGTAYAWGYNEYGQLGNGASGAGVRSTTPVPVSGTGPSGVALIVLSAGYYHSLGLAANGTAYAWGDNTNGQLGNGTRGSGVISTTPAAVSGTGPGGVALTAIAAGERHSLGLAANGTAYAWGWNFYGQIGNGTSGVNDYITTPGPVSGTGPSGIALTTIAAGGFHNLGLAANGTAYAWGRNLEGQIGNGTSGGIQTTPAAVSGTGPGGVKLIAIVGGTVHSLASGDASDPYCAGFVDMAANDPACPAVAVLTQQGTIRGYAGVPPRFGPTDNVQRAQVAAFLVRALAWQNHPTGPRTYTDLAGLATELRTSSLIVANTCDGNGLCVAYGYGDGRFGPTDNVSHAQVITFIARAFRLDPVQTWVPQPGDPQPYIGIPAVHDTDVRTFVHYAGPIPSAPSIAAGWNAPASRAWVAMLLYQALTVQP